MRSTFLHEDSIFHWIDDNEEIISNAIERNYERWDDFIGEYIWIEPEPIPETYDEEILVMKNWISNRLLWLDSEMPGNCNDTEIVETNDDGNKNIIMIIDHLGRQTNYTKNKILIYYDTKFKVKCERRFEINQMKNTPKLKSRNDYNKNRFLESGIFPPRVASFH